MMTEKKPENLDRLKDSIYYLRVTELREIALHLDLPPRGPKGQIISRILCFLETGQILKVPHFPTTSLAQKGRIYSLRPESLMLKGAYKNDLATRNFFKSLIGAYFHFTAFGIDWLNERWLAGNPPTYKEFADMWVAETQRRKSSPKSPKTEWAYINFIRRILEQNPSLSHHEITKLWHEERLRHKEIVIEITKRYRAGFLRKGD